ncbi:uncharacterized mitochondrial protein AtMg01250-like [Cryptomeria japonica]|uniref:uncharacterized mitochondrial protein AtMg01250-like n=1 Tax=Cryptomeria japonica TaxID=3369 RepID=UPI0027DA9E80|nr:uncharacterized mitochondrial protein AtMg01250-like [Cryptomeria japonica]
MALKLDISKAYDKVNWNFLYVVLSKMGFRGRFLNVIKVAVENVHYSVIVNDTPWGFFKFGKGLRQGAPLSPYLFIMVAKVLSRNFSHLIRNRKISGVKAASTLPPVVMQQFVDDTFLFGQSFVIEAKEWKHLLEDYALASGQIINYNKSKIYFFNMDRNLQGKLMQILGCCVANLPDSYLGLPLTIKEVTPQFWESILERMQKKLVG